ncbi:acyl-[acyl-carrier-protein] thioesterase [Carboxylicivirga marina]|uniref:acyl-[acyl-carrier-protein] thioesterase n=1 Tax=Carboxylicivirga marina TaxID=2800988 RepID=UPI0025931564|nr:acyl-ACP thioesterase domain-containing protein [uncultured Carboxylicivirga sp.]
MNTQLKLRKKYTVTSADTDMFSRLKLSALVNYLIQSAISSAEKLGFGLKDLKEENLFWVLNRMTIEINRPVLWSEEIEVETWPKNVERIFYIRDFVIRDKNSNIIAKASSAWLAIDYNSKRPSNFNPEKIEIFTRLKGVDALSYSPEKLGNINNNIQQHITPSYFDIDLNKHVTSTRYVDWLMDLYPVEFHQENYPKIFSVNYIKETMHGETIALSQQKDGNTHTFEGYNSAQEKVAMRAKITFDGSSDNN